MRKSVLHISPICRLLLLLLILLVCFVDASKETIYSPFRVPKNKTLQISGEPSIVRRYTLWNRCTQRFVRIRKSGKKGVDALGRHAEARYTTLIVKSIGQQGKILIQGEKSGLYLCFSKRGKLRARHNVKPTCEFYYNIVNEYDQFRLVANEQWFIGFKKRGKRKGRPLPGYKKRPGTAMEKCYDFYLRQKNRPQKPIIGPFNFDHSDFDPEEPKLINQNRSRNPKIHHRKSRRRKKGRRNR